MWPPPPPSGGGGPPLQPRELPREVLVGPHLPPSVSFPALTGSFSSTLLTLLEQLTPSLPSAAPDERLHALTTALKEILATTILFPSSLPSPRSSASLTPSTSSSSSFSAITVAAPAGSPAKSSPLVEAVAVPLSASVPSAVRSRGALTPSAPRPSPLPAPSTTSPPFAELRVICDLLLLCYIDVLSRPSVPSSSPSAPETSPSSPALSIPPSAPALSFLAFLTSHPHFATTSAFSSLLGFFASQCGLSFLVHAAHAQQRMRTALSFIAAHGLAHVTPALIALLVSTQSHALLLSTAAGSHVFRCLHAGARLELCLLLLLQPQPGMALGTLTAVAGLLDELDVHGLYRVCTILDPHTGTVPAKGLDNYARILVLETWLHAIIRLRATAQRLERTRNSAHHAGENALRSDGVAREAEEDDEELGFYTDERLQEALHTHRGAYRAWRVLAALLDHGLLLAVAALYEANLQWTDAFETRLCHIRSAQPPPSATALSADLLGLLDLHCLRVPSGVERARLLALLALAWRDCALQEEALERAWIDRLDELADSLCTLVFASPTSLLSAIPALSAEHPLSFSPVLRLHLTAYRLRLLHAAQSSSLSSPEPVPGPRLWHALLSRLQSPVHRRSHLVIHPPVALDAGHSYAHDDVLCFTCGHCHWAHDVYEALLPALLSRLHTLDADVAELQHWLEAEYTKVRTHTLSDSNRLRLCLPSVGSPLSLPPLPLSFSLCAAAAAGVVAACKDGEPFRVACPQCLFTAVQAEAARMAQTVARVYAEGTAPTVAQLPGSAKDAAKGRQSRDSGAAMGAAGRSEGSPVSAEWGHALHRSPVASPTTARSGGGTQRDRAAKLETWR